MSEYNDCLFLCIEISEYSDCKINKNRQYENKSVENGDYFMFNNIESTCVVLLL